MDFLIGAAVFSLGYAVSYPVAVGAAFLYLLLQDGWGRSLGKRLFGLRLFQEGTQVPATLAQGVLRNVPFAFGFLLVAVPAFWVFFAIVMVPLMAVEVFFVLRLESGLRLGDVLAHVYLDDGLRRPAPRDGAGNPPPR